MLLCVRMHRSRSVVQNKGKAIARRKSTTQPSLIDPPGWKVSVRGESMHNIMCVDKPKALGNQIRRHQVRNEYITEYIFLPVLVSIDSCPTARSTPDVSILMI